MSLSGINFSGLGSGIDTESIITQLLKLDQTPITKLQKQQQTILNQQSAIGQVSAAVTSLQAAAESLNSTLGFSTVKAQSTDDTILKVSAASGAASGSHTLQVTQLAQTQKIGSIGLTSQTTALGVGGQIVLNGKAINVATTDSLQSIAANINSAQVGVSASIVSPTTNTYKLVLSSTTSGTANTINLSDAGGGTILQTTLGLINAGTSVHNPITNGAASNLFKDSATSIGTLLGQTAPQAGTIKIDGTDVAIDFATDSLTAITGKINNAGITGVTASIVTTTDPNSGESRQQLQIVGASTPTFTDSSNLLTNLGVLQNTPKSELAAAKDATFKLDGLDITRSSNTVTDVLSGVTLNLIKDTGSPTTNFTVSPDVDTIKGRIQSFVSAYNQLGSTVGKLSAFDPDTLTGGPLFGDVATQNVLNSVTDILTGGVPGLTGQGATKTLFSQIGLTLDKTNTLSVNDSDLTAALNNNLSDVARIFQAAGVATDSSISFVSATAKSKGGVSGAYAIDITQVATQATLTAGTTHSADDNPNTEILTFTGAQFGSIGKTVLLSPNSSLDGIVSQINADKTLGALISASNVGGKLALTSRQYGANSSFYVHSSQGAANNNSGIGTTDLNATALDVAGTINGEVATGKGQFLTGNIGNATTEGLQIRVTSTVPGQHGTISFSQGIAAQVKYYGKSASDSIDGALTKYASALNDQYTDIADEITRLQEGIKNHEVVLRTRFSAMEGAVSRLKSAGNSLAGLASLASSN